MKQGARQKTAENLIILLLLRTTHYGTSRTLLTMFDGAQSCAMVWMRFSDLTADLPHSECR